MITPPYMRGEAISHTGRPAQRLAYLDVMRGLAIVVMIESHVFHSFTRLDLRKGGAYQLSQSIGGMAAPLFLFIAGIMVGFRIENREDKGLPPLARLRDVLKRAGYIFVVAELILLQQLLFQWPYWKWTYLLRVDILNCMALAVAVSSLIALVGREKRAHFAAALGAAIAGLAPVASALDWSGIPVPVSDYLIPHPGRFAFFPEAAYVPLGIAVGILIRRATEHNLETAMRWMALAGLALLYAGEFFSNQPYSLYPKSEFWLNSPGLITIRTGITLVTLVAAFLWTRLGLFIGILRQLGTTSLLVYWVHIELVYGSWLRVIKKRLTPDQVVVVFVAVVGLMYALSLAKTKYWPAISASRLVRVRAREAVDARVS